VFQSSLKLKRIGAANNVETNQDQNTENAHGT